MNALSWQYMKLSLKVFLGLLGLLLPALGYAAPDKPAPAEEKTASAEKGPLPSPTEVLERYARAIGGKEAFMKHTSQHALGSIQLPGINGKMEVFAARPNKLLMKTSVPGVGDVNTGYDGKVGWMSSAITGPMLLKGKMLDPIATQADFDQALHNPEDYKTIQVLGTEDFNGEDCYKLRLVHRTGFDSTEYFSKKSGLQVGFLATQESPLGAVTATTVVNEYKKFGDLYMPSKSTQKAAGVETVSTIDEVEYDRVDPSVFELPPEVKTLLERPAEKPQAPRTTEKKQEK